MSATKRFKEHPSHKPECKLIVDGKEMPPATDWEVVSPFGNVYPSIALDGVGNPKFDRPSVSELSNVNIIVFGRDDNDVVHIGIIHQARPHADDPEQPNAIKHDALVFGQVPMGFIEPLLKESSEEAAIREVGEETGAHVVVRVTRPKYPWHNPSPSFVSSWSDIHFVEVDLSKVEEFKEELPESIHSAEFITIPELIKRIANGKDEKGSVYRGCTSNSALMIFLATFPELWKLN